MAAMKHDFCKKEIRIFFTEGLDRGEQIEIPREISF
jgi:hypothetical protein